MGYFIKILFIFLFVNASLSQVQIVDSPEPNFEERITSAVNEIRIIDTHEHLATEAQRIQSAEEIDFTLLFSHYAKEDLISASNNKGLIEIIYKND